jgi:hypothetical protein
MVSKFGLLTLSDQHWLKVLGNRMQRRIFGPKGDEVISE